jgi:hypothetical protein
VRESLTLNRAQGGRAEVGVGGAHGTGEAGECRWREGALVLGASDGAAERRLAVSLATPEKIRTLQKKLYVKAKSEPEYRFYLPYDKVWRADISEHAHRLCRENGGAAGVDGVTFESIEAMGKGRESWLSALAVELREERYRPQVPGRGIRPFSNRYLYEDLGLVRLQTSRRVSRSQAMA